MKLDKTKEISAALDTHRINQVWILPRSGIITRPSKRLLMGLFLSKKRKIWSSGRVCQSFLRQPSSTRYPQTVASRSTNKVFLPAPSTHFCVGSPSTVTSQPPCRWTHQRLSGVAATLKEKSRMRERARASVSIATSSQTGWSATTRVESALTPVRIDNCFVKHT